MDTNLDDFFAEATRATSIQPSVSEALTSEEEEELRQFALQRMATQAAEQAANQQPQELGEEEEEEEVPEEEPQPEPEPEPEPECPPLERVVEVPDYSNVREEVTRFSGAEWFKTVQNQNVILAGVGGIGSNMAIILAKLNPKAIYMFDIDTVSTVNIAGQFYKREDVGKPKVDALAENIVAFTGYSCVFACNRMYNEGEQIVGNIMVCGFDNMRARRVFFNAWKAHVGMQSDEEKKNCLFIDGRLTADEFQIFCMTGEDDYYMDKYQHDYLFTDREAARTVCSFKQTGYLAQMIGAFMVNLLVNHCANMSNPIRQMPLPFLTSYKADVVYLNTEK